MSASAASATTRTRQSASTTATSSVWPDPLPQPVRVCRALWSHLRARLWEYRESDRRYVCCTCHPRAVVVRETTEPALTLAQWHALPLDTLSQERRLVFEQARMAGFPSARLPRFAATVGSSGEPGWRAFVRVGSAEMVRAASAALEGARR